MSFTARYNNRHLCLKTLQNVQYLSNCLGDYQENNVSLHSIYNTDQLCVFIKTIKENIALEDAPLSRLEENSEYLLNKENVNGLMISTFCIIMYHTSVCYCRIITDAEL